MKRVFTGTVRVPFPISSAGGAINARFKSTVDKFSAFVILKPTNGLEILCDLQLLPSLKGIFLSLMLTQHSVPSLIS